MYNFDLNQMSPLGNETILLFICNKSMHYNINSIELDVERYTTCRKNV